MSDENKNIENKQEENQNRQECNKSWWKNCWVMGNQTFFTKSKILEKVVKPNLRSDIVRYIRSLCLDKMKLKYKG